MKKVIVLTTALVAAAALAVGVGSAIGSGGPISEESGFACNFFDESGNVVGPTFQSTDTVYASGKEVLHCIGQSATGGDGAVHLFTGFGCNLLHSSSASALNSDRVSKTGESQLWCYGTVSPTGSPSGGAAGVIG
jgi:hypothetical protein